MPDQTNFADLYKKLLDHNFEPDPQRSNAVLDAILWQLFPCGTPEASQDVLKDNDTP
ncbi:MAG: hypothetical protein IIY70_01545 [Oscillospiraceae bacterium]|nr:hypothetical protein [Oscillospiraceae bacterium]